MWFFYQYGVSTPYLLFFDSILIKYGVRLIKYGVRLIKYGVRFQYQGTESPVENSPQTGKQICGSLVSCVPDPNPSFQFCWFYPFANNMMHCFSHAKQHGAVPPYWCTSLFVVVQLFAATI
jgi:hypothetical protein